MKYETGQIFQHQFILLQLAGPVDKWRSYYKPFICRFQLIDVLLIRCNVQSQKSVWSRNFKLNLTLEKYPVTPPSLPSI